MICPHLLEAYFDELTLNYRPTSYFKPDVIGLKRLPQHDVQQCMELCNVHSSVIGVAWMMFN